MKISNSTGKNKDFYDLGKKMFDRIRVLPEHQAVPQIPQKHSSKRMTVFELIEANGLTLHGDIEHFAELVRADEREACAKVCDDKFAEYPETDPDYAFALAASDLAKAIRARGNK
jgi:CRISPR/Cas system-associated protein Csm6